ncbi:MAG: PilZ domain-containing protein [SAR324 cluster bacterium]|nr:PilZ domain-containing protein [SAR324 cluster bacterium]
MFSIKGTYENGKIKLLEPIKIDSSIDVIITFLDHDIPFSTETAYEHGMGTTQSGLSPDIEQDDQPEDYYQKLREHKRYKAAGDITVVEGTESETFPLNDYSSGGLSFISSHAFPVSKQITATLKYSAGEELLIMDFEMEVRGVFEQDDGKFKIGCQFDDQVDEQLWHTVMG